MSKKQVAGYILDKRIGKGSYATVWKGHTENGDEVVAVKVISRQTVTETAQLRQEVEVLRRISHPNIVRFRDLKKSASHFYLVLEFCAGGDLSQFVRERGHVQEETARKFLTQIAAGICMLHRENVLHRDLKPQNILLSNSSDDPVLKIADFGFARALQPQDMAATVCGSPLYMAPEILRHEPYDAKADLWSVGAILYELLLGRPPFNGANPMQLLANIERSEGVAFDGAQVSSDGQEFLKSLLMRSPARRLSSKEFARHAYVRLCILPDSRDSMVGSAEAIVYATDGSALITPREWCMPPDAQGAGAEIANRSSDAASPLVASPAAGLSPEASPREGKFQEASFKMATESEVREGPAPNWAAAPKAEPAAGAAAAAVSAADGASAHASAAPAPTADQVSPTTPTLLPTADTAASPSSLPATDSAATSAAVLQAAPPGTGHGVPQEDAAFATACRALGSSPEHVSGAAGGDQEEDFGRQEEYVVLTEQGPPIAAQRYACGDFCGNLSRIAHMLEKLAKQRLEQHVAVDALALLLRAMGLLEKALKLSISEDEMSEPLRQDFARMLQVAEVAAQQIRTPPLSPSEDEAFPAAARPNLVIFEFAVQQAKEAAVALSKGYEEGGWEEECHEKLTLALLLLDLLGSEADGEDLATISSYTAQISWLVGEIGRFDQRRCKAGKAENASWRPRSATSWGVLG